MSIAELPNNRPRDPNINSVGAEFERTPPQDLIAEHNIEAYVHASFLINLLNSPYGFAMLGREDISPEPITRFNVPRMAKFCRSKKL